MILILSVVGFIVTLFEMFWKEILIGLIIILLLTPAIYYLVSKYGGRASKTPLNKNKDILNTFKRADARNDDVGNINKKPKVCDKGSGEKSFESSSASIDREVASEFAESVSDFVLEMMALAASDEENDNVVIENSFNTTVENWSDDDIATGEIDFGNIQEVDIACKEMTYRIEEREEFDIVMTNFLTEQDGWQHYETKTVEYEVPDGYEYTFLIYYKDGRREMRIYHESVDIAERLIEISERF